MRKEFVVKSIDAAPDGAPYVVVSMSSLKDMNEGGGSPASPFGQPRMMGFTNMNDMVKDLNKMLSGVNNPTGITQIKMDMHEYKGMNLAVGDRVYLDITKAETLGV